MAAGGRVGRAHVEGEWLGRMFRAGRHARYMPWSSEGRGPGSGAPPRGRHTRPGGPTIRRNSARISWMVLEKQGRVSGRCTITLWELKIKFPNTLLGEALSPIK